MWEVAQTLTWQCDSGMTWQITQTYNVTVWQWNDVTGGTDIQCDSVTVEWCDRWNRHTMWQCDSGMMWEVAQTLTWQTCQSHDRSSTLHRINYSYVLMTTGLLKTREGSRCTPRLTTSVTLGHYIFGAWKVIVKLLKSPLYKFLAATYPTATLRSYLLYVGCWISRMCSYFV